MNDDPWNDYTVLQDAWNNYPATVVLQQQKDCPALGITSYQGVKDAFLYGPHKNPSHDYSHKNYGGSRTFWSGYYSRYYRAILQFDVTAIPQNARIGAAWMQMYMTEQSSRLEGGTFTGYEVLKPWGEGTGAGKTSTTGDVNWHNNAYPDQWAQAGCAGVGTDRGGDTVASGDFIAAVPKWVTVSVDKALIKKWVDDPSSNHGILLTNEEKSCAKMLSKEFYDRALSPRLIISFTSGVDARKTNCELRTASGELKVWPNPFDGVCNIMVGKSDVGSQRSDIRIYDVRGDLIYNAVRGSHSAIRTWDGKDNLGRQVPAGTYLITVKNGNRTLKQLKLIKQ